MGAGIMLFGCSDPVPQKPNVVFIMADDLGWADLPAYGNQFNEAPNISRLAEEGMRFTNAYASAPVCSPTRASLMSGQYPPRVGVVDFIPGHYRPYEKVIVPENRNQYLPENITTIGEIMKKAGYSTAYFGKWHLGWSKKHHPLNQGFDVANTGVGFYNTRFNPPRDDYRGKRFSERITDFGIDFIQKNKDNPFFLFLSHYDVHVQLNADSALIAKYRNKEKPEGYPGNAVYAAMIEHLDKSVGRVSEKIEELGLSENTLFIFYSDNGGLIKRYDNRPLIANDKASLYQGDTLLYIATSNQPLRGEKGTVYEGGIREPLIVKWPPVVDPGETTDEVITTVDFFPTFLEILGDSGPTDQMMDGESFLKILKGDNREDERAIFWHYPVYHHDVPASAVRKGKWKLIHDLESDSYELYDLENDIGETRDVSNSFPDKTDELSALLDNWRKEIGARLPQPNPDFDESKREQWGRRP